MNNIDFTVRTYGEAQFSVHVRINDDLVLTELFTSPEEIIPAKESLIDKAIKMKERSDKAKQLQSMLNGETYAN